MRLLLPPQGWDIVQVLAQQSMPWWRHQMETFPALLAICEGNSRLSKQSWGWWFETPSRPLWPVTQRSVTQSFDSFYDLRLEKKSWLSKLCDRWPVNSPHQGTATRKMFEFDDVFMLGYYAWAPDYHCGIATNQADLWAFTPKCNTLVWFVWHACINKGTMWPSLSPCTVIYPILLTYLLLA